jgi:hypothetical protein
MLIINHLHNKKTQNLNQMDLSFQYKTLKAK